MNPTKCPFIVWQNADYRVVCVELNEIIPHRIRFEKRGTPDYMGDRGWVSVEDDHARFLTAMSLDLLKIGDAK